MHIQRAVALALCLAAGPLLVAQTPPADRPTFEAASIKKNVSGSDNVSVRGQPGGRVSITNNPLRNIIRNAYRLQNFQIVGGPDWINMDRWDIVAKAEGDPPPERMIVMLQNLLADRFKLVVHREMRESPIYALVFARSDRRLGPQLHPSSTDCAAIMAAARARGGAPPSPPGDGPLCGTRITPGHMMTSATTMADLARILSPTAGRSIVDRTGLTGNFDLELTWTPDSPTGPAGADGARPAAENSASIFTAVQEQLGLKLEPQRGPVDTLVIESAERPVED